LAKQFATEGMSVVLADVEQEPLNARAHELLGDGFPAIAVHTDVSDAASVSALGDRTVDEFGAIHVVCNNAGVAGTGQMAWELPLAAWEWMVNVNLLGVVHGVRTFLPLLVEQGEGHMVNTTSLAGLVAGVGSAPYTATKHAIVGLTEALKFELELIQSPVKVSLLVPGRVDTRIGDALRNWPTESGPVPEARRDDRLGVMPIPKVLERMLKEPLHPSAVASLVVDAIHAERFWVVSHPAELAALIGDRARTFSEAEPRFSV
jgi:NAD(P)-dependent dehydrogenase (short-subunit alcohol dehydrogenase family)